MPEQRRWSGYAVALFDTMHNIPFHGHPVHPVNPVKEQRPANPWSIATEPLWFRPGLGNRRLVHVRPKV